MPENEVTIFEGHNFNEKSFNNYINSQINNKNNRLFGIKRPNLLCQSEFAERVSKYCPKTKLIMVLRLPIERTVSAYYHYMRWGFFPVEDIESGIPKLLYGDYKQKYWKSFEIIEFSFYGKYIKKLYDFVDKNNIYIGLFEDLIHNPKVFLKSVFDFLEIEPLELCFDDIIKKKPQSVIYSLDRLKIITMQHRFEKFVDENGCIIPGKGGKKITDEDREKIDLIKKFDGRVLRSIYSNVKPCLSESLLQMMRETYDEDIKLTSKLIDRPLTEWQQY